MRNRLILLTLKMLDYLCNVDKDKPLYLVFLGEGEVIVQKSGEDSKFYKL